MSLTTQEKALISKWVYNNPVNPVNITELTNKGWEVLTFDNNNNFNETEKYQFFHGANGYAGAALRNIDTGEVIIAHRGTEGIFNLEDVKTDLNLIRSQNPQLASAEQFYNLLKANNPNAKITEVGHSLGGTIAQQLAIQHNEEAITFNAAGVGHLISDSDYHKYMNISEYKNKIQNYVNPDDIVASFFPQIGQIHYVNIPNQPSNNNWLKWLNTGAYLIDNAIDKFSAVNHEHSIDNFINSFSEITEIPANCNYSNLKNVRQDILNKTSPYTNVIEILDDLHDTPDTIKNISANGAKAVINLTKDSVNYIIIKAANTVSVIKDTFQQDYNQAEVYLNNQISKFKKTSAESLNINADKKQGTDLLDIFLNKDQAVPTWMQNVTLTTPENIYQVKTKNILTNYIDQEFQQELYSLDNILNFESNYALYSDDRVKENYILFKSDETLKTPLQPEKIKVDSYQKMVLSGNPKNNILSNYDHTETYYSDGTYSYYYQGEGNDPLYLLAVPNYLNQASPEDGYYLDAPFEYGDFNFEWISEDAYINYNDIYHDYGTPPEDNWDTVYQYYNISFNDNEIGVEEKNILISPDTNPESDINYKIFGTSDNDQLIGGNTNNEFSGGNGQDMFIINSASTTDSILDFSYSDDQVLLKNTTSTPWQIEAINQDQNTILSIAASNKKIILNNVNKTQLDKNNVICISKNINIIPYFISSNPDLTSTNEDTSVFLDVLANASDINGDTLNISAITQGSNSTVELIDNKVKYTPNANYFGNDSYSYTISDGNGGTITQTVNVTINPVNDTPTATLIFDTIDEDTIVLLDVLASASDIEGNQISLIKITQGTNGIVEITADTKIKYTPNTNYNGTDFFTYTITDGTASVTKTVTMTINSINDLPTATLVSGTTQKDTLLLLDVLAPASDIDGDILSISAITQGTNGIVEIIDNKVKYTPNANYLGNDTFSYTISDGQSEVSKTVDIKVFPTGMDSKYYITPNIGAISINDNGGNDEVNFDENIIKQNIAIFQNSNNLQIDLGNGDKIDITNQFLSQNEIEKFVCNDKSYLTANDINTIIQEMTAFSADEGINLTSINDVKNNTELMNLISNSWHS